MRLPRRLVVWLILIAAVVLVVEYAAAPRAKRLVVEEVERATGLALDVRAVSLSIWRGAATAYDVVVPNPPPFREPTLLRARALTVNLALMPLLARRVVVQKIGLRKAYLTVERNRQGRTNVQALLERPGLKALLARHPSLRVKKVVLADSTLRLIDHAAGVPPARLVLEETQAVVTNLDRARTDDPLASRFRAQAAIATPRRGRLFLVGRTNLFHPSVNFDLRLTAESLDLPVLQRLHPARPVVFLDGLAFLTTEATCRNNRLTAHNRLLLYKLDFRPRGEELRVAGLPPQTVVALLEQEDRIELEFEVTGDVRNPRVDLRPAVERLVAKALHDKVLAGPRVILQAGKTGAKASAKALQTGKEAGGVALEGAKRFGSGLKKLFSR
ncbi:MAG: hypothetical protein ACE5H5_04475 [Nitrospinota bacterium]